MATAREFTLSRQDFKFVSDTVYDMTGIVLKEHKFEMVYARLSRRLRGLNMANFSDYVDLLQGPGRDTEISFLIDALTTNLTRFFREDYQLKHLLREVQQRQQHGGPDKSIRIWSAGCSSGQEPYSIGMALSAGLKERARACRILATDIDRNVLNKAKNGLYTKQEIEDIPPNFKSKYLRDANDGKYKITRDISNMIVFNSLNLMNPWPFKHKFDFIFCRNVVIYFDEPTKNKLAKRFMDSLNDNGVLFLGHSEALMGAIDGLVPAGRAAFRKVAAA